MHIATSHFSCLAASLAFILKILLFSVTFWPWLSHTSPSYDLSKKQFEGQVFTKPIKNGSDFNLNFSKNSQKLFEVTSSIEWSADYIFSWPFLYIHVQNMYNIEFVWLPWKTMEKIIGHFVLGKNVGQFGEDQRTSDTQLFQYPDGQGQNVPSHSPPQSGSDYPIVGK